MHISGESIAKLAQAVQSLNDAQLDDDHQLFVKLSEESYCPVLAGHDEEPDKPMTVGDLRELLRPFAAWFA